jgi:hypothetical protein
MGRVLLVVVVLVTLSSLSARAAVDKENIDRAIDNGVAALRRMQQPDGSWPHDKIGATALAGLTILEMVGDREDKSVLAAAAKVREASPRLTDTYSLALSVLFLDRLENVADTPLIESMLVRLIAGQRHGCWDYECPKISEEEVRRLKAETGDGSRVLKSGRDLSKLPAKGKRTKDDLPKEIQDQIALITRLAGRGADAGLGGDNSNTQFATLALWVGRRYGIPAQGPLLAIDKHFRSSQRTNGGWGYSVVAPGPGGLAPAAPAFAHVEPAMTCAGLLGLAVGHGASLDIKKKKNPKLESTDVSKDSQIKLGFADLANHVGKPTGWSGAGKPAVDIPIASGKAYYYFWSLERTAVVYNVETIGKKDWYNWGAEILLVSQRGNGSWVGGYSECGADTCFALLFLKRVNLARDLSSGLSGGKGLGGARNLKAGGVGGSGLKLAGDKGPTVPGLGDKSSGSGSTDTPRPSVGEKRPAERTVRKPRSPEEAAARKLTDDLVSASGERRATLLKELRDTKGAEYTEALADVISRLDGEGRRNARAALADRLTRMKAATLRSYLKDDDVEIRRAAALAVAQKDAMSLVPDLIRLLNDPESLVERAAHAALKAMSGKDLGPRSGADRAERAKAIAAWEAWWEKKARE